MRRILKGAVLGISLFIFLLVVVGGGLHLNPAGALLAAATRTPLIIHAFNRWNCGIQVNPRRNLSDDPLSTPDNRSILRSNDSLRQ